jgi:hypothetical protein
MKATVTKALADEYAVFVQGIKRHGCLFIPIDKNTNII